MFAKRFIQIALILAVVLASFSFPHGASANTCGSTYVVRPGDWLSKIAARCGVTLSSLYAANPWVGYYIYPGQVLNIPGGPVNPGPGPAQVDCGPRYSAYYGNYWVVCRGDTLLAIALYYGEHLSYIQWHNNIPNANRIYVGQFIWP
jgi:hypothetical protein